MRAKRSFVILALVLTMLGSVPAMAAAARQSYTYNNTSEVNGYVQFIEGPLTIPDKVNYNVSITGKNISKCTVAYNLVVDNKSTESGTLDSSHPSVNVFK